MPFVAADGENYLTANSYCSVAVADDYHSLRGNTAWAALSESEKQAALVKASDYLDQRYGARFLGTSLTDSLLAWPRDTTIADDDIVPVGIQKACAALALDTIGGSLSPNIAPLGALKRKKVDVLEREYFAPTSPMTIRPEIDGYMRPYIAGPLLNVPVVRA